MNSKKFIYYLKEYFAFSRSERNGIIILFSGIIVIIFIKILLPFLYPQKPKIDIRKFEKEIALFEKSNDSIYQNFKKNYKQKDSLRIKLKYKKEVIQKIELNAADSISLVELPAIGPVFAHRIIKYRKLLGGYYSIDQLSEVFGLNNEICDKLKNYIFIDSSGVKKININTATFKEINKHPYITFEQTKKILKYRAIHPILSIAAVKEMDVFTESELTKVLPYLGFE